MDSTHDYIGIFLLGATIFVFISFPLAIVLYFVSLIRRKRNLEIEKNNSIKPKSRVYTIIKNLSGSLLIILGLILSSWVFYNLFIELQSEAKNTNPASAIFLSVGLIVWGLHKITDGDFLNYKIWKNREFQKWALAGCCLLFIAFCVNMVIRFNTISIGFFEFIFISIVDLFALYILFRIISSLFIMVFKKEKFYL